MASRRSSLVKERFITILHCFTLPPRKTKLVKKTLGWKLNSSRDLEKEFGRFGPLEKCKVVLDGKSGQVDAWSRLHIFLPISILSHEALLFWPLNLLTMLRLQGTRWPTQVHTLTPHIFSSNITQVSDFSTHLCTVLDGRKIRVDYSITKRAHTPTPGMYMGR